MNASAEQWHHPDKLPADVRQALNLLEQYKSSTLPDARTPDARTPDARTPDERANPGIFTEHSPMVAARAPGRLDVMGGIADYSGSEVLQMPTAEAAVALAQESDQSVIRVITLDTQGNCKRPEFVAPLSDITAGESAARIPLNKVHQFFKNHPQGDWAAYMAGVVPVLLQHLNMELKGGINLFVVSSVPEGKGVSSSAAIEVACMRALLTLLETELDSSALAILCQKVENIVVGAPCGLMDQMSSAAGKSGQLMSLLCQPAILNPSVLMPENLSVWGIDSGIRHAVTGASYGSVRIGAFMGYRMLLEHAGIADARHTDTPIKDTRWGGFLANVTPSEWSDEFACKIPESMSGQQFLDRYSVWSDPVSEPDPDVIYSVRHPTAHPIFEYFRIRLFKQLATSHSVDAARLMGECMFQSHASYSACGLGSSGTDALVERLRAAGVKKGIYGARITGGGSGGTVAVLADKRADAHIRELAADYAQDTGHGGHVFHGSSDGAMAWRLALGHAQ